MSKTWNNSLADHVWETTANWTGGVPGASDDAIIPDASVVDPPNGPVGATTIKSITFTHGRLNSFIYSNLALSNSGGTAMTMTSVADIELANVTGKINELSGTGTIVTIDNLTGSANYSGTAVMVISGGNGTIKFNSDALGTNNQQISTAFTGTIISDTNAIDLAASSLNPAVTLQALNGGTLTDFTQERTTGQQAKYATVTGGVGQSHAQASSYVINVVAGLTAVGFVADHVLFVGQDDVDNVSISGTSITLPTPSGVGLGLATVQLRDELHSIYINLDTITVTAAASSVPLNRVSISNEVSL